MTNQLDLTQWINSAAEAFHDFMGQLLMNDQEIGSDSLELFDGHDVHALGLLAGASLFLEVEQGTTIALKILASKSALSELTHLMLNTSKHEPIEQEDIIDAIKEIVNIVSGGVKCRLNSEYNDSIVLGLPLYIEERIMNGDGTSVWGTLRMNNIEIFLSVKNTIA